MKNTKNLFWLVIFVITINNLSSAQWLLVDPLPQTYNLNCVQLVTPTIGYAVGDNGTILKTTDGGTTWALQSSGTTNPLRDISFISENIGTVVGEFGTILRTTNGGMNWKQQTDSENVYLAHTNLWCISFIDSNNGVSGGNYFYGFDAGDDIIFRTTNGGENWVLSNWGHGAVINDISYLDLTNAIAIVDPWGYSTGWKILKSSNNGETWGEMNTLSGINNISFIDTSFGIAVGNSGRIARTTNGGTDWTKQLSVTTNNLYSVSFSDINYGTVVGDGGIILRTSDGGTIWNLQLSSITKKFRSVSFIDENNGIAVGEDGIILRTTNGGVTAVDEKERGTNPTNFILLQNYPNPFNPSTKISWQSPISSWQILKVYGVLGNEVATLVDEYKPAGSYEVEFDARGLTSGIYFYTLQAGSYTQTKKLILMK
jgi:photosystem II stability/assembly factor-like uncharacterized protein